MTPRLTPAAGSPLSGYAARYPDMATPPNPTGAQIVGWTGLNQYIASTSALQFQNWLQGLVPDAEAEVANIIGEEEYDNTDWSARKALLLARAVAYYTAAAALISPELQKATGTQSPFLMKDPEEIAAVSERLRERGRELMALCTLGAPAGPKFALPVFGSAGVDWHPGDLSPGDRNDLFDERDDLSDQRPR